MVERQLGGWLGCAWGAGCRTPDPTPGSTKRCAQNGRAGTVGPGGARRPGGRSGSPQRGVPAPGTGAAGHRHRRTPGRDQPPGPGARHDGPGRPSRRTGPVQPAAQPPPGGHRARRRRGRHRRGRLGCRRTRWGWWDRRGRERPGHLDPVAPGRGILRRPRRQLQPVARGVDQLRRNRAGRDPGQGRRGGPESDPGLPQPAQPRPGPAPAAPGHLRTDPDRGGRDPGRRHRRLDRPAARTGQGRGPDRRPGARLVPHRRHVDRADQACGQGVRLGRPVRAGARHPGPPVLEQPPALRGDGRLLVQPPERDEPVRRRLGRTDLVRQSGDPQARPRQVLRHARRQRPQPGDASLPEQQRVAPQVGQRELRPGSCWSCTRSGSTAATPNPTYATARTS